MAQDEFIKTDDLNDNYLNDKYQKNYTENINQNANLYKSAEWSNKAMGEAKIIIKTRHKLDEVATETTVVYAFITCNVHGFTSEIAKRNIGHLLQYYDHVDIIGIDGNDINGIHLFEDVKNNEIDTILSNFIFDSNKHYSTSIYTGLYQYLYGSVDSTVQIRDPSAIYVSLDLVTTYASDTPSKLYTKAAGIYDYQYDCWNLLKKYQSEGRYFSMTGFDFNRSSNYMARRDYFLANGFNFLINSLPSSEFPEEPFNETYRKVINTTIGLADPKSFPGIDADYCILDGAQKEFISDSNNSKVYKGEFNGGDYSYSQELSVQEPVVITNSLIITDKVKEQFEIVSYSCNNSDAVIDEDDNTITVLIDNYISNDEVIITINIKVKEKYNENLKKQDGSWFDTNDGNVNVKLLIQGKNTISIESSSPKLSLANALSKESVINVIEILKNPETGRKFDIVLVVILTSLGIGTFIYKKKRV